MSLDKKRLQALRATIIAELAQVDALIMGVDEPVQAVVADAGCQHKSKISAPRMGAPEAWVCATCDHEGGLPEKEA